MTVRLTRQGEPTATSAEREPAVRIRRDLVRAAVGAAVLRPRLAAGLALAYAGAKVVEQFVTRGVRLLLVRPALCS